MHNNPLVKLTKHIKRPLVSVIIPTFNRFALLNEALESVQSQSYKNIEIIIVDDGSTDKTEETINNDSVNYIRIDHTGKPGHLRNIGAKIASGEYFAFLDSDDIWKHEKIEKQINYFRKHPDISICHTKEIWQRGNRIISQTKQKHNRSGNIFPDALKKCIIGPSTVMLKRKLFFDIGMFYPDLEIAEDYELWLRICAGYIIGYIDEPLVIKRAGHSDQLSLKYGHIEIFRIRALLKNIKRNVFDKENLILAKSELSRKCRIYAKGCIKRNKIQEAAYYNSLSEIYNQSLNNQSLNICNKKV